MFVRNRGLCIECFRRRNVKRWSECFTLFWGIREGARRLGFSWVWKDGRYLRLKEEGRF